MRRRRPGIALLTALLILVFLFLLGLTYRFYCDQHLIFTSDVARRNQLYYLAEAGIEYCIYDRVNWPSGSPPAGTFPLEFPSGYVEVDVIDAGGNLALISRGMLRRTLNDSLFSRNGVVTIRATISTSGEILSWRVE
ncbi:MAG: hypothetical protein RDV48_17185 [Candidatus Eremiobacteraeota bacterium]|nr:hypothetical protein [Candidatus Eremiobacteraeota bacterium]